ncbi:nuclear RNA export factor 1, partial [Brachionus plicatilis]
SNMIGFSLTGVFKEGKPTDKVRPLRSFSRSFVCVPDPEIQMTIINDQYVISNITEQQYKKYFQQNQRPVDSTQESPQPSTSLNNFSDEKTVMIQKFSIESKLNLEWSKYCLEHAQWNFEQAAKIFMEHRDNIPKEAFLN